MFPSHDPAVGNVIVTTGSAQAPLSHLNDDITGSRGDRQRRIEVLRSEMFTLDPVGKTSMDYSYNIEMNGPTVQRKQHMKFASSSTATAISGGLYFLIVSDSATAAEIAWTINSKVVFYDN